MRTVIFLSGQGYAAAWQATSVALTAAAMGDEVVLVVGFGALRPLADGRLGVPVGPDEEAMARRGEGFGAATPQRMLSELKGLGARVLACSTTARLVGLEAAALPGVEVLGLPEIWRLTDGARVLTF